VHKGKLSRGEEGLVEIKKSREKKKMSQPKEPSSKKDG